MSDEQATETISYRLRRESGPWRERFRVLWARRWFRWFSYLFGVALLGIIALWFAVIRGLPDAKTLIDYQPPLPTHVRSYDGSPVFSYARERRVQLSYAEYPPMLVNAFTSAEDKTFFTHGGIDYVGVISAIFTNIRSDGRSVGASTITQQVAKNLLLTNEYSYVRKIKEAVLARRIESVLSKEQILELYLNQIALGRNSFGVQAAARAYFNKDVDQLTLAECAFLAILPKAPEKYGREKFADEAIGRRNWVLGQMVENGKINQAQYAEAAAQPLGIQVTQAPTYDLNAGYFMEEIRRSLIDRFGEQADNGQNPNSVYAGGLWVRSSLNPEYQAAAERALRNGLNRYGGSGSWGGPVREIDVSGDWAAALRITGAQTSIPDWRIGVVLEKSGNAATIGFGDGNKGRMPSYAANLPVRKKGGVAFNALKAGDVILTQQSGNDWVLRSIPEISGGLVAQDPHTGRVLAMQGGYDAGVHSFNRATQALRQPGSSIKPFVYAAGLDAGMTPATQVLDGSFCVGQGPKGRKCFTNFGGSVGYGSHTMRWGLEQSRNLMTVRIASQAGMENVNALIERVGIGKDYPDVLAISLGAGDTTVMKITNAFSILSNNGRELQPTLIDYVQDRNGKVIEGTRADTRLAQCPRCNMKDYDGKSMPRLPARGGQVVDPITAYQVVHMLEGVVQNGTAKPLMALGRPIFGKTGTTTGPTNVWFVGGSADVTIGVYMGFDQPRPMGSYAQGGTMAVPIFKDFANTAMKDMPVVPFRISPGVRMVRIDRTSGRRVYGAWPDSDSVSSGVIWEAFKPETEPMRTIRKDEIAGKPKTKAPTGPKKEAPKKGPANTNRAPDDNFQEREGGIY